MSSAQQSGPSSGYRTAIAAARPRRARLAARALAASAAALLWLAPSAGAAATFAPATDHPADTGAINVAARDLDGDGRLDLAVVNQSAGTISVLLGDGSGGFGPATNYAVGAVPRDIAIGDFNGDGKPDLATALAGAGLNSVAVLLGDGTGAFGAPALFGVGTSPGGLATGDLDGDGKLDLAVTNQGSASVSILRGDGAGGFGAPASFATGAQPRGIAISDLDGDGRPDLAIANLGSGGVSVLLGDGSGGFGPATSYATGAGAVGIAVRDLDGDGRRDLAVANSGAGTVSVLLGDGHGGFGAATSFAAGAGAAGVAIADLDLDGRPDLAVGDLSSSSVSVLSGDGAGGFGAPTTLALPSGVFSVAAADLDGDGKPDLAATQAATSSVRVLLNTTIPPDVTPPVIAHSATGTVGDDGWYTSDAQLTWTVTDPESAIGSRTGCATVDVTADQQATAYTCTATSAGGTASSTVSIKRDAHAPTIAVTGVTDGATYDVGSVPAAGCDTRDATSGVATAATPSSSGGPLGSVTATCSAARDRAGNTRAAVSVTYRVVDPTPPSIVPTTTGTLGHDGWYTTDAGLSWTVTDPESAIGSRSGCGAVAVTADQPSTDYTCTATSAGGSASRTVSIKRDAHAPTVAVTGVANGATYASGSFPVAGCATQDATSGVASAATLSSTGGPTGAVAATCSGAKDNAGNVAAAVSVTYTVTATPAPTYDGVVAADNPGWWWHLGEASGTAMTAEAGGASGSYQNGVVLGQPGAVGATSTAARFDGKAAYGYVNAIAAPKQAYTLEAWMNASAPVADGTLVDHGGAGALIVRSDRFCFRQTQTSVCWAQAPVAGSWYHVAGTWDAVSKIAHLYVDGVERASGPAPGTPSGSGTLYVGYGQSAPWFRGLLDEVAYYPTALGGARIAAHYHGGCAC